MPKNFLLILLPVPPQDSPFHLVHCSSVIPSHLGTEASRLMVLPAGRLLPAVGLPAVSSLEGEGRRKQRNLYWLQLLHKVLSAARITACAQCCLSSLFLIISCFSLAYKNKKLDFPILEGDASCGKSQP